MRRTGLAFRLLLSLLLVLNGIGSAVAGVRMAMPAMADVAVQEAARRIPAALPPGGDGRCDARDADAAYGDHRQGDGDCCTSGACDAAGCPCPCTALCRRVVADAPVLACARARLAACGRAHRPASVAAAPPTAGSTADRLTVAPRPRAASRTPCAPRPPTDPHPCHRHSPRCRPAARIPRAGASCGAHSPAARCSAGLWPRARAGPASAARGPRRHRLHPGRRNPGELHRQDPPRGHRQRQPAGAAAALEGGAARSPARPATTRRAGRSTARTPRSTGTGILAGEHGWRARHELRRHPPRRELPLPGFRVRQSGTYWYHSHSGCQEQGPGIR